MTNDVLESLRVCAAEGPCTKCHEIIGIKCIGNLTRKAADSIENLLTENAALRRQIDRLTSAQEMLGKELEEVKAERDAALRMMWEGVGADDLPESVMAGKGG